MTKIYHSKKYLIKQLKTKTYIEIAKENKVSPDAIQHHMGKHGLTKKRISWTKEELMLLEKNYGLNPSIYNLFPNRSISSINHKASRLDIKRLSHSRKYSINHYFFKNWSPEMAYILGFLFSDGHVTNDGREVNLHLNKKDHYILNKIRKVMGSDRPVRIYSEASLLRIGSKVLVDDLMNLGCIPRKSLILKFPKIEDKFLPHFIRGFFDGDGSIHFNRPNTIKVTFISTKSFIMSLQNSLNRVLNLRIGPLQRHYKVWIALYYGDDARKLCKWMYKNSKDLYLKRKKDRFDKHMWLRESGKI